MIEVIGVSRPNRKSCLADLFPTDADLRRNALEAVVVAGALNLAVGGFQRERCRESLLLLRRETWDVFPVHHR